MQYIQYYTAIVIASALLFIRYCEFNQLKSDENLSLQNKCWKPML